MNTIPLAGIGSAVFSSGAGLILWVDYQLDPFLFGPLTINRNVVKSQHYFLCFPALVLSVIYLVFFLDTNMNFYLLGLFYPSSKVVHRYFLIVLITTVCPYVPNA